MTKLLDRIFDSLPLTMLSVVIVCTVFMVLLILLFRPKGQTLAVAPFGGAPDTDGGTQAGKPGRITRKKLPPNVTAVAFFLMLMGIAGLIACFNGIDLNRKVCFGLALAGFLGLFGYDFAANGAINRMNYFKIALKYFSMAVLFASGAFLLMVIFITCNGAPFTRVLACKVLAALAAGYLGGLGYYYGFRFYQNFDAMEIGSAFGFVPADSGIFSDDWIYDSKGVMNGVETLFNIEVTSEGGGRYSRTIYYHKLEVLCYCVNPLGIGLSAGDGWDGLIQWVSTAFRRMKLEPMQAPEKWKSLGNFRSDLPLKVSENLEKCGADASVFLYDFKNLSLYRDEFKFVFFRKERPWTEPEVKRILNASTRLAASFN